MPKHVRSSVYMTFETENGFVEQKIDHENERGNESKCLHPLKIWIPKAASMKPYLILFRCYFRYTTVNSSLNEQYSNRASFDVALKHVYVCDLDCYIPPH